MNKIFVVEDDKNIRELILYALSSNKFEAVGFESGDELFSALRTDSGPSLIILDVMLPGIDGINILKILKNKDSTNKISVIMLSAKSDEYDKIKGLDLGADDYITKPFSVLELISRINAVLRRSTKESVNSNIIKLKNVEIDVKKHTVKVDNVNISLTYKEFELLQYLLVNKGIVLSRDKIMERVWGIDFEGESRTVDMHIKTLRQKLKNASLIETVRGIGYKIGEWNEKANIY